MCLEEELHIFLNACQVKISFTTSLSRVPKYLSGYSCQVQIVFVEALVSTEVSSIIEGGGANALVPLSLKFQQPTTAGSHSSRHHVNRGIYNSWHLAVTVSRQCRQPQATLKQLKLMLMPKQTADGACCRLASSAVTTTPLKLCTQTGALIHTHKYTHKGLKYATVFICYIKCFCFVSSPLCLTLPFLGLCSVLMMPMLTHRFKWLH